MECSPTKKKFLMGIWFLKKGFKSNRFQVVVWSQNLRFFLFRISSQIWRFMASLALPVLKPSHAIDLLPSWLWKWKVKSESESEVKVIPFWSFIFPETYIYYIACIYLYCYRGVKVHNNYLMGLIFSTSWSVPPRKKNSLWGYDF